MKILAPILVSSALAKRIPIPDRANLGNSDRPEGPYRAIDNMHEVTNNIANNIMNQVDNKNIFKRFINNYGPQELENKQHVYLHLQHSEHNRDTPNEIGKDHSIISNLGKNSWKFYCVKFCMPLIENVLNQVGVVDGNAAYWKREHPVHYNTLFQDCAQPCKQAYSHQLTNSGWENEFAMDVKQIMQDLQYGNEI